METVYREIYRLAQPYLNTRHNDIHTESSYRFARLLLRHEPGDPEVALPAIICHDLGWSALPEHLQLQAFGPTFREELRRVHEVEGVRLAREILEKVGYDAAKTAEILQIIDGHDSRLTPISDSDRIVKDSDKLYRLTPLGFSIDVERLHQDRTWFFNWTRERIDSWFLTATGKELALRMMEKRKREL